MTSSAIDCDVIKRTKTEQVGLGEDDSFCRVRNNIMYVLSRRTVSALTRALFLCLFPMLLRNSGNKHQNIPLVSAETVRHSSTYIILYVLVLHIVVVVHTFVYNSIIWTGITGYFMEWINFDKFLVLRLFLFEYYFTKRFTEDAPWQVCMIKARIVLFLFRFINLPFKFILRPIRGSFHY